MGLIKPTKGGIQENIYQEAGNMWWSDGLHMNFSKDGHIIETWKNASSKKLGDAAAADVLSGKTFTSDNGLKVTGSHVCAVDISAIIITGLKSTDSITCVCGDVSYIPAWDETAQHWEIVGLPLGTFTITATDGTSTKSVTVLIDISGVYEINIIYKLYLYQNGDECEDVTGGWAKIAGYGKATETAYNTGTALYVEARGDSGGNGALARIGTVNTIDLTGYSKLNVEIDSASSSSGGSVKILKGSTILDNVCIDSTTSFSGVKTIDLSDYQTEDTIVIQCYSGPSTSNYGKISISQIWLD